MRAVFIDRDGTIGGDTEATYPPNFVLYDNVLDSIELLKASGFKVIAFTNQPDIAMGKVSQKEFEDELFGFKFNDVCICPHLPSDLCKCRKPGTYMGFSYGLSCALLDSLVYEDSKTGKQVFQLLMDDCSEKLK